MGFIYEETNHYGVEAIVALERYCTPSDEKTCTAATEATRICETYGIPERELLPLVRPLAAAEEYMLEHLTADRDALQFLFTPMAGNTCLAWSLVWDYIQAGGGSQSINIQDIQSSSVCWTWRPLPSSIRRERSPCRNGWTPQTSSSTIWTAPASRQRTSGGF